MKNLFMLLLLLTLSVAGMAQELVRVKSGETITIQNGLELTIQGSITFEDSSSLINNGSVRLLNNAVANGSDWLDNSLNGALSGTGLVIFNSISNQNFSGNTNFYNVQLNSAGLTLNNNLTVSNIMNLVNGAVNTNGFLVNLNNSDPASLANDSSNTGYTKSWINGSLRRTVATNAAAYDFPVGGGTGSNLLQFLNNNITGTGYLTASFGPKPDSDTGLNCIEKGAVYNGVNSGGVWYLVPDVQPLAGNYALQLYFNGFTGLTDNLFGIIRRPDSSSNAADWMVPTGSTMEIFNGPGRKLSDGFASRFNISDFSQWGIGMLSTLPCDSCTSTFPAAPITSRLGPSTNQPNASNELTAGTLSVLAYPNPYNGNFSLRINTPVSGMAIVQFFTMTGAKFFETRRYLNGGRGNTVPYTGPHHTGALIYRVTIGHKRVSGFAIGTE